MKLSPRLQAIFDELTPGVPVVDVCCDHGYLGAQAYLSEQFPEVIFIDQVKETMLQLEAKFHQHVKNDEIQTRVSFITADARKVKTPLSGNIVIAGVGGKNMMEMLGGLFHSPDFKPTRLILSPHRNPELYETPELFGLKQLRSTSITEGSVTSPIFVFSV